MKGLPTNFNWVEYLKLNPDVKRVFNNEQGAINHYLKYGRFENRKYCIEKPILNNEITDEKELIQNNTNDVTVILENIETEIITPIQIEDNEKKDDNVEIKVIKKKRKKK
jgi:hypothetical protein